MKQSKNSSIYHQSKSCIHFRSTFAVDWVSQRPQRLKISAKMMVLQLSTYSAFTPSSSVQTFRLFSLVQTKIAGRKSAVNHFPKQRTTIWSSQKKWSQSGSTEPWSGSSAVWKPFSSWFWLLEQVQEAGQAIISMEQYGYKTLRCIYCNCRFLLYKQK